MKLFDAHFHIIDSRFPLVPNNGYLPPYFTVADYQKKAQELSITGGAIVSGSFQEFDQSYLIHSLKALGDAFYGVANIPNTIKSTLLDRLQEANITAVRFNLKRGGSAGLDSMVALSNRLYKNYGWHTELYVESTELLKLRPILAQLPPFSIDHLGLSKWGLDELYYWAEKGMKIKATGFGRLDFDPIPVLKELYRIHPKAVLFGTDLPSTRAKTPFNTKHLEAIQEAFSETALEKILYSNALEWYAK